jgi:hypothetical protein
MADWRQIQARIRKAKASADAPSKLSELYQRTRDAMVAWELALIEEKAERMAEAGKWYQIAAQRFRRADWKKKAEEALARLGIELPSTPVEEPAKHAAAPATVEASESPMPLALGEIPENEESSSDAPDSDSDESHEAISAVSEAAAPAGEAGKKKRRRGRRGGRGRRRGSSPAAPGLPAQSFASPSEVLVSRLGPPPEIARTSFDVPIPVRRSAPVEMPVPVQHAPQLPSERTAHGRAGDPALASRMAHLESMLRRLVASPLHRLEEADTAPAGPGVFLLSDSDQISSYYIEACQTLRVGIGNLARGGRSGKPVSGRGYSADSGLKSKLADHLGINEGKVSQYMKDHCVVRWIQLDDDAPLLAHFAIGVLRTPLNLD